jgi:AmpD protein
MTMRRARSFAMSAKRLSVDRDGIVRAAAQVPSPNCDERPAGAAITLLVVHGISLPPGEFGGPGIVELFTNRLDPAAHPYYGDVAKLRVSSHFVIRRDGSLTQFVSCLKRAWHAGASSWRGRSRCNDFSVGIELEGSDDAPFEDAQYEALAFLLTDLREKLPLRAIAGHSEIAPGRKTDPGAQFDWGRLLAALARPPAL